NGVEVALGWDPLSSDSDGDGIPDGDEEYDSDNDGLMDSYELANGLDPYDASDGLADADQDGFSYATEVLSGTSDMNPTQFPVSTIAVPVQASAHDADQGDWGYMTLTSVKLRMGDDGSKDRSAGVRFPVNAEVGDVVEARIGFV